MFGLTGAGMHVAVGDSVYDLRTISGKLVVNGETSASVVDHDKREILVSDCVPVELRMHVAAQAVSEAWAARDRQAAGGAVRGDGVLGRVRDLPLARGGSQGILHSRESPGFRRGLKEDHARASARPGTPRASADGLGLFLGRALDRRAGFDVGDDPVDAAHALQQVLGDHGGDGAGDLAEHQRADLVVLRREPRKTRATNSRFFMPACWQASSTACWASAVNSILIMLLLRFMSCSVNANQHEINLFFATSDAMRYRIRVFSGGKPQAGEARHGFVRVSGAGGYRANDK